MGSLDNAENAKRNFFFDHPIFKKNTAQKNKQKSAKKIWKNHYSMIFDN